MNNYTSRRIKMSRPCSFLRSKKISCHLKISANPYYQFNPFFHPIAQSYPAASIVFYWLPALAFILTGSVPPVVAFAGTFTE